MSEHHFDLIVIGSGPAGEMAAVQGGFLDKRVALIEKENVLGGAAVNTGTIPSKTLRETALFAAGYRKRSLYGLDLSVVPERLTAREFLYRERHVAEREREKIATRLKAANVKIFTGVASLTGPHTVQVADTDGSASELTAEVIMIATGSRPFRPPLFPEEAERVYDSNTILDLERLPDSMIIAGAGVIGCEYASLFASLGVGITLIHSQEAILSFLDVEIQQNLEKALVAAGIRLVKPDRVVSVAETAKQLSVVLENAGPLSADCLLAATGRASNTEGLGLETAGIAIGDRGLIPVNEHYQTNVPHIYAAGDVIGFPALASTSIEQGRIAIEHAFRPAEEIPVSKLLPYGIYTIPECAMAGETEEQLRAQGIDFVVGRANYADNARGLIIGEEFGLLKLLFERESKRLLAVHIIGEEATELVHIGAIAIGTEATAGTFMRSCFNYPTLSELYKHASWNAFGKPAIE